MQPRDFDIDYTPGVGYRRIPKKGFINISIRREVPYIGPHAGKYCGFINAEKIAGLSDNRPFGHVPLHVVHMPRDSDEAQVFNSRNNKQAICRKIPQAARRFWRWHCSQRYRLAIAKWLARGVTGMPMEMGMAIADHLACARPRL